MALDGYSGQNLSRQARAAELLDAETEARLARAWREHGDRAALDRLVRAYMRLAIATAARFRRYGASMNDLTQEASLGLLKAAEKFDPDRGVRFSTYAVWWIRASVQDHVMRNWSLVRTGSTAGQKALFFNLARIRARTAREAAAAGTVLTADETELRIAETLGVSRAEVRLMEGRLSGMDLSLDAPVSGDDEGRAWVDLIEDDGPGTEARVAARHDGARLRQWLGGALASLTPRERRIVEARRLAEAPRTLEDLGQELCLSKERVRQIEAAAYQKMRRTLAPHAKELALFLG